MEAENKKGKVSSFFGKIGKRNLIIAAAFVVVAAALITSVALFGKGKGGFDYSRGVGAEGNGGEDATDVAAKATDTYFASVQVNRKRTRDEALDVLQKVVDNKESTAKAKEDALAEINKMAKTMKAETDIESLVMAKGFAECVAVISDDGAKIVVKADELQVAQISQINEIVFEQSGIAPANVNIIKR